MYSSTFRTPPPPALTPTCNLCFREGKAHVAPKHIPPHLEIIAVQELRVCASTLHKCSHTRTG